MSLFVITDGYKVDGIIQVDTSYERIHELWNDFIFNDKGCKYDPSVTNMFIEYLQMREIKKIEKIDSYQLQVF